MSRISMHKFEDVNVLLSSYLNNFRGQGTMSLILWPNGKEICEYQCNQSPQGLIEVKTDNYILCLGTHID